MATIIRRRGSKIWTAFFRDERGRQHCLSTKETDKRVAIVIAQDWEKAARQKRSMRQTQKVIDRLHEMISGERIARLSIREFVDSWLKAKKLETAPSTFAFYSASVSKFLSFLKVRADLPITEITRDDILKYRSTLAEHLSAKSVNHDLKVIKMVFRTARRDSLVADDPAEFVDTVKRQRRDSREKRPFTLEELRAVLSVADEEWQSMILFGLYTGQRLGDLATLNWSNVDLENAQVRLTTSKTGKVLIIPMAEPLKRHVESLKLSDDPLSPIHPRAWTIVERQGKSGNLSNQFADLLAQAGLRKRKSHKSANIGRSARRASNALSFHSLRRTATTMMHEAGMPAAVVQAMIGHDSEAMHKLYISVGSDAMRNAANALPDILSLPRAAALET
jgi:integrase